MSIPLIILLGIYILFLIGFSIYALLNLYHVFHYGHLDAPTYFMTGIFIAGFILILFVSYTLLSQIDWSTQIELFPVFGSTEIPTTQF